jgi:hypothetical protein
MMDDAQSALEALFMARFDALRNELESLRILTQHDLAAIQLRLSDSKTALDAALTSSTEAITRAEIATEKRFDSVNESRGQLKDQQATFITRSEMNALIGSVQNSVLQNKDQVALSMPRSEAMMNYDRNETTIKGVDSRLKILETGSANLAGKMWMFGGIITIFNVVLTWWIGVNSIAAHLH